MVNNQEESFVCIDIRGCTGIGCASSGSASITGACACQLRWPWLLETANIRTVCKRFIRSGGVCLDKTRRKNFFDNRLRRFEPDCKFELHPESSVALRI